LVDREQWFLLGSRLLAGLLDGVAPALRRPEVMDEDAPKTHLADLVRSCPDLVRDAVEGVEDSGRRPPVVVEQVADVVDIHPVYPASRRSAGNSVGEPATRKPAAWSASTFEAAVPAPPEMIAPAWPMRLPSGAVRPAMNAALGTSRRCSAAHAAAVSSAAPPISPMRISASVSGSAANRCRMSRKGVTMTGSPPMPTHVDWPTPASVIACTASYVSVPERETTPTEPSRWIEPGMIPTFARPGDVAPGQFGPMSRAPARSTAATTGTMSRAGMPSVMQKIVPIPAAVASRIASGAPPAGTKMHDVFAPVSRTPSATVSNTGTVPSSATWPPFPGVTPATTFVP